VSDEEGEMSDEQVIVGDGFEVPPYIHRKEYKSKWQHNKQFHLLYLFRR
jgi:hypothetical protein